MQNPGSQEPLAARSSGVSPRAALVVLALLLAAGALYWLLAGTRPEVEVVNVGINEESTEIEIAPLLSPSEARAEFKRLHAGLAEAVRRRDVALLSEYATKDGPVFMNAREAIQNHLDDHVIDMSTYRFLRMDVVDVSSSTFRLRTVGLFDICVQSEEGENLSQGPRVLRQVNLWTVQSDQNGWLIDRGVLKKLSKESGHARCFG